MSLTKTGRAGGALSNTRFYGILDIAYVPVERWTNVCVALIEGGASLIQIRAKHASPSERKELVRKVLHLFDPVSGKPPFLVINDDVELCARLPGTGLHIGQEDTPPAEARRRIGSDRLLGLSTHSQRQAQAALDLPEGVLNYFCTGPVFATPTKPDYAPVGLDLVRWVAGRHPDLTWYCIGGINRENMSEVIRAGAKRVVVVSDVLLDADPASAVRAITAQL